MSRRKEMSNQNLQAISAEQIAKKGMLLITSGKIRNHKLRNSSRIHTGEVEDREYQVYRDFLPSKNCCIVLDLRGSDFYE